MIKIIYSLVVLLSLIGCTTIKPMVLPQYNTPDLSKIVRPEISVPVEGRDYTISIENGTVTYTLSGQNLLTAKIISEKAAWIQIEMLIQIIDLQTQIIHQKDELIITIDLAHQYAERGKTYADVKAVLAEVLAVIIAAVAIAGVL